MLKTLSLMFIRFPKWFEKAEVKPLLSVVPAPEWTNEYSRQLLTFLSNPAGRALLARARALEASMAIKACGGEGDPKTTAGFTFAVNWLESLTISGEVPAQTSIGQDEADSPDLATKFAI